MSVSRRDESRVHTYRTFQTYVDTDLTALWRRALSRTYRHYDYAGIRDRKYSTSFCEFACDVVGRARALSSPWQEQFTFVVLVASAHALSPCSITGTNTGQTVELLLHVAHLNAGQTQSTARHFGKSQMLRKTQQTPPPFVL